MIHVNPYKTALELGITDDEYNGLIKLIDIFENQPVKFDIRLYVSRPYDLDDEVEIGKTTCCIGGHLAILLGAKTVNDIILYARQKSTSLDPLFRPSKFHNRFSSLFGYSQDPHDAAIAIHEFLCGTY